MFNAKILCAGCLGLARTVSAQFYSWNVYRSLKSRKIHYKTIFLGFKVVQGHQCWYHRDVRPSAAETFVLWHCFVTDPDLPIWCSWVRRFPSIERAIEHQRGIPPPPSKNRYFTTIGWSIAWKRLHIDTDLLRRPTITSTADDLSGGTNIGDLVRPWTPK